MAGEMSNDEHDEGLIAQHHARLVMAATTLLRQERGANRAVKGFTWEDHVENMVESEFKLRYRLGSTAFYELLEILGPELKVKNEKNAMNARSGSPIQLPTRLAVGWLALPCRW